MNTSKVEAIRLTSDSPMISGWRFRMLKSIALANIILVILRHTRSLRRTKMLAAEIKNRIRQYKGSVSVNKASLHNRKIYWDMYGVGWPSARFNRNVIHECCRIEHAEATDIGLRNVLFGITTKCPLQCEHCYEWQNLNKPEALSASDLELVIQKLLDHGVMQVHLGGGEPMMRYDTILALVKKYSPQIGFWIVTSGHGLTTERAVALKNAGLTGICVSLDHYLEEQHNQFRHNKNAYSAARDAVQAGNTAGLLTALSICCTRSFISMANLLAYADLAKLWGVSFVQLLEPRAVGNYAGKQVELGQNEKQLLSEFFLTLNRDSHYKQYPMVIYHEYYKKTLGCRGAGNGALYIDPLGEVHSCPFCRHSFGSILTDPLQVCLSRMKLKGCEAVQFPMESSIPTLQNQIEIPESVH